MESGARFDSTQLFIGDSRIVLGMLNHVRYQALNRVSACRARRRTC